MKPFDANGAFIPVVGGAHIQLGVRSAGITVFSGALGLAAQIIGTVILARLLTPRDFGLVAMVTTFSLLLMNFGLNGFTEVVLQWQDINHALASNLFWINLSAGLILTVGFAAAGSLLARFYRDPLVARVAVGMSATILVTSTSVLHVALLKRAMRFFLTSTNDVVARTTSVAISILLAWAGWGYWALVAGAVMLPLAQSIGAWSLCRWVPGLPRYAAGTGSMVRFAMDVYSRFSLNYVTRNLDNLLVGWRFSAQALGFYKKAYDLFTLSAAQTVAPLTNVAVATLSRFDRNSTEYKRYIMSALAMMAFLGMGLGAALTLVGKDVISLLLGRQWAESARIFVCFGPGIGIMLLYHTNGWIHLSIGRADRWFRWGIVEFATTVLLFLLALPWGPIGIAVAWTASFWILTIPALWYAGEPIGLGVTPVMDAVWKYPVASLLAGSLCAGIMRVFSPPVAVPGAAAALARIVTTSALFAVLYLGAVILLHRGYAPLYQMTRLLREIVPPARISKQFASVAATRPTNTAGAIYPPSADENMSGL